MEKKAGCFYLLLLCAVCTRLPAYEVEFNAGSRYVSGTASVCTGFAWNASKVVDAFAFSSSGNGMLFVDTKKQPALNTNFRTNLSYSSGSLVSGLRLDFSEDRSVEEQTDTVNMVLSFPVTLNGSSCSFGLVPFFGTDFFDDSGYSFGADIFVSLLAGDFVFKPGFGVSRTLADSGSKFLELKPSLGLVWYPGIPLTADLSFGWSFLDSKEGEFMGTFPFSLSLSAVPFDWLYLGARFRGLADGQRLLSYTAEADIEFNRYNRNGTELHFPLLFFYSREEDSRIRYGVTVLVGFSFEG